MLARLSSGLFLALLLAFTWTAPARAAQTIDGVVAVVNDGVILRSELETEVQRISARLRAEGRPPPPGDTLRKQVLDSLVMRQIQLQEARRRGISVSDDQVDQAVSAVAQQNRMSMGQFRRALASRGMSLNDVRERIREDLLIERLRTQEVRSQVSVSDRDVELFLENQEMRQDRNQSYHLMHILIAVPDDAAPAEVEAARNQARNVMQQAREGTDFAQLAISYSDGQQALNGGDLGWIESGALPSVFRDVVPTLEAGQVGDPIRSPSGFHVIKLAEVRGDTAERISMNRARHILLQPNAERGPEETRALIESLYQRIQSGTPLAELAREYSDDDGSAPEGGDLGWQPAGTFVPSFENQVERMRPGQVSRPFRTRFGWHIVKLMDRRQQQVTDDMQRNRARQVIGQRRAREHYELWLRRLRDEAYVEYRLQGQRNHVSGLSDDTPSA